MNKTM